MDSPPIRPPEPDQLFSKPGTIEPTGPSMLGARNVDSVLFNIKDLDGATGSEAEARSAREFERDTGDSGLIDVSKLVPDAPDGKRRPPTIPSVAPPGSLVAEVQSRPTGQHSAVTPQSKAQTYILVTAILALLGVAILLAIKALG